MSCVMIINSCDVVQQVEVWCFVVGVFVSIIIGLRGGDFIENLS